MHAGVTKVESIDSIDTQSLDVMSICDCAVQWTRRRHRSCAICSTLASSIELETERLPEGLATAKCGIYA